MKPCLVPISVFWILAALFYSTPALAVDRYVRLNGFDTGDCTSFLQACRTPGYALDVALPGDEIVIVVPLPARPTGDAGDIEPGRVGAGAGFELVADEAP